VPGPGDGFVQHIVTGIDSPTAMGFRGNSNESSGLGVSVGVAVSVGVLVGSGVTVTVGVAVAVCV
jgi:hypothetical protein